MLVEAASLGTASSEVIILSLRPDPDPGVPEATARTAKAAFPKGSLAIRIRDAVGPLFRDEQLSALFPHRGAPAISPWRLALVSVLQFAEGSV